MIVTIAPARGRRIALAATAMLLSSVPAPAQISTGAFVARSPSPDPIWRYGGDLTASAGWLALRASAGTRWGISSTTDSVGAGSPWIADGDVLVVPFLSGGGASVIRPYVLAGLGMQSAAAGDTLGVPAAHWSYGAGLAVTPVAGFRMTLEGRTRRPLDAERAGAFTTGDARHEVRAGMSLSFGGLPIAPSRDPGRARRPGATRPRLPPIPGRPVGGAVLPTARQYLGVPYRWGGTSPSGFDCSGFVQYVFARHDVALPRTSRAMANEGQAVGRSLDAARPGDLLFFAEDGRGVSHVAIFVERNRIIHSSSSGGGVRYDDLATSRGRWFASRLVGIRRTSAGAIALEDLVRALERGLPSSSLRDLEPPDRAPRP